MTGSGRIGPVRRYHERSTHHPGHYAPGPGFLDWANQPEPFRTYSGAPVVGLPLAGTDVSAAWDGLHRPGAVAPCSLDRASLGAFFELALGITAWKEHGGSRWALRANPSSGNLHPTEAYALFPASPGLPAGLYHYLSRDHVLERRFTPSPASAEALARLQGGAFLVGLASIHWREAWKYGERAFRYCQHDVGHALGSLRYAAAALGWSARLLETPGDDDVSALLGLDRDEDFAAVAVADREHPDGLAVVAPPSVIDAAVEGIGGGLDALRESLRDGDWAGTPNALSSEHVEWPAIADVAVATGKPRTPALPRGSVPTCPEGVLLGPVNPSPAVSLIRTRRSAVAMDGATALSTTAFFAILGRLLPCPGVPPWDVLPWTPRVHPVFFVHRVDGLAQGLYLLERGPGAHAALRGALRNSFAWERAEGSRPASPSSASRRATSVPSRASRAATRRSRRIRHSPWRCLRTSASSMKTRGGTGACTGRRGSWARRFTWRPRRPRCAARASAASSTTLSTTRWASATAASVTSTTSRSGRRSRTGGSRRGPATATRSDAECDGAIV